MSSPEMLRQLDAAIVEATNDNPFGQLKAILEAAKVSEVFHDLVVARRMVSPHLEIEDIVSLFATGIDIGCRMTGLGKLN